MILKDSVRLDVPLSPQVWVAMLQADTVYKTLFHDYDGIRVTSLTDGNRKPTSLHFWGFAFDIGIRRITKNEAQTFTTRLQEILGPSFQVILEDNCIHVEYDPRAMASWPFENWLIR